MKGKINPVNQKINKIEVTSDVLTGRGGLALFVRYLTTINIYPILFSHFSGLRKSVKGKQITNIFKQIFCFFFDGTNLKLSYFDRHKKDQGYAEVIENTLEDMCSSHMIRRFFKSFTAVKTWLFRQVLQALFIWRLNITKPRLIELTIDTMVMNNNEAQKREGSKVTYKKVKGFQPLNLIWENKIVDSVFRGGNRHSNHANTAKNMIRKAVKLIRKRYSEDVTIIIKNDSGFFDEEICELCDKELGIGFIGAGKLYPDTKEIIELSRENSTFQIYENNNTIWEYYDFGYRYKSWENFYRAIYTNVQSEESQLLLDFAKPAEIIITNVGVNPKIFKGLTELEISEYCGSANIIERNHQRGKSELCHRGLKEFGIETLPLEKFVPNSAYYYCMLIAFFLFETFKMDVASEIVKISSYANTVRRTIIDIAGKIVHTGNEIILKVTETVMKFLNFGRLWYLANNAFPIKA